MKIIRLSLTHLHNEEHFQFMTFVKGLIILAGAEFLKIPCLYALFLSLFAKEDSALEVIRKNALTDPIADADAARDAAYRGFTLLVETYGYSSDATKVDAAKNIRIVIDRYGDFRAKSYNEETATIYNFVQDISDRCAADVTTLDAQSWVDDLSAANQTFDDLMNQRFDAEAGQQVINLRETRKEIDKVYTDITERINAFALVDDENDYSDFINKLNERIVYFKNTLSIRKGRAGKVTKGEGQG